MPATSASKTRQALDRSTLIDEASANITRLTRDLRAAEAELQGCRQRFRPVEQSWEQRAAQALATGKPLPDRVGPPSEMVQASERVHVTERALGIARRDHAETSRSESWQALETTKNQRISIYRKKLAAIRQLIEAENEHAALREELSALGYDPAVADWVVMASALWLQGKAQEFATRVQELEGVVL